jgi:PAS domain S-box-containing protein
MSSTDAGSTPFDVRLPELAPLLLEHAGAPVFLVGEQGRLLHTNTALRRLIGLEPDQVVELGRLLALMTSEPESIDQARSVFAELLAKGDGSREIEMVVSTWDGTRSLLRWTLRATRGLDGAYVVALGRDLTERTKTERWVRMFAQIMGRLHDAVFVTDLEGAVLFWGGGSTSLLGHEPERVMERNLASFLVGDEAPQLAAALLRDAQRPEGVERTVELQRSDGGVVRCYLKAGPVLDLHGRPIGLAFVATPAVGLETSASPDESSEVSPLDDALARSGLVALITTDAEGRVLTWNKAAERLGGRGAKRAVGKRLLDEVMVVQDLDWGVVASHLQARGRYQHAKVRVVRPNGTLAVATLEVVGMRGPDGGTQGGLVMLHDHTEQANLAEELLFAKQGALNATFTEGVVHRLESAVAALVPGTHELARSMQVLGRLAGMVLEGRSSEQLKAFATAQGLENVESSAAEDLYELAEGVHQLQRTSRDARHFLDASAEAPRAVHLERELDVALDLVKHRLAGRCSVELRLSVLPPARAIRGPLLRAFCLALMAAADSCSRSQARGRCLVISGDVREGWVHLAIQDDGEGYGVDVRSRLGDLAYLARQPGIGALMLGLCREELRAAGGNLELDGAPGAGTTMRMAFPAAGASASRPSSGANVEGGVSVLIIEEDDLFRRALERHLAASFPTSASETVGAVLEPVSQGRFAAVVVGFPSPEGYGLKLMRRLAEANSALWRNTVLLVPPGMRRGTRQVLQDSGAVVLPRDTDTGSIITILSRMLAD